MNDSDDSDALRPVREQLEARTRSLAERVKEMQCLLDISRMLTNATADTLDEALTAVVARLPAGWQVPKRAGARLRIGDREWRSPGYADGHHRMRSPLPDGELEVSYPDAPGLPRPVFLAEEEDLLEAVATRIVEARRRVEVDAQVHFQATLLDQVDEAVVAVGPDGRIRYWNRGAEKVYGWTAEEALGRHSRRLLTADADMDHWRLRLDAVYRGETPTLELELARKDGSTFPGLVTQTAVRDAEGRITTVVGVTRDLSQQKAVEEQLRQAQKLDAIGQLTGGVAHDFNNLLTVIMGNVDLMAELAGDDPELRELADQTRTAAAHGADLTSRLLAFARKQTLAPRITNLGRHLADLHGLLRRTLGETIDVTIECDDDLWPALVDPAQFDHALLNLCLNARDAMPGGGHLAIRADNHRLTPPRDAPAPTEALPAGDYVRLRVADTGSGMTDEVAERAFDPFFTTKEVGQGSGLGLSMVYGFVRQSGGDVRIRSTLREGTEVSLLLPRARRAQTDERTGRRRPDLPRGSGEHVLLVEDEDLLRDHVTRQLESLGYRVTAVADARAALKALDDASAFDLLFTDVVLPGGIDGFELAARVRAQRPGLPVLYTTGFSRHTHDTPASGDLPLLYKPYVIDTLAARIRDTLRGTPNR